MLLRKLTLAAAAGLALGLAACGDQLTAPPAPADAPAFAAARADEVIPNRYIVVFHDDVADAPGLARQLTAAHGGKLHHTYRYTVKGFAATLPPAAVEALRKHPRVEYVHPDRKAYPATTQFGAAWGLDRVDQRDRPLSGGYDYTRTGFGVTAYVLDSGIETSNPDFGGRASIGWDGVGDGSQDCSGHGTGVAGTLGSATYGVAKAVRLVAVKVLCAGSTWSTVTAGIDWVAGNAVKPAVANLSIGGGFDETATRAVRVLIDTGVTVVVAAGNEGSDACGRTPAEAITVGASNSSDQVWTGSNQGSCVDLFAPGEGVASYTTGGAVVWWTGTSIAAPHVAGAAALYLHGAPAASHAAVQSFLLDNATTGRLSSLTAGSPNRLLYSLATVDSYLRLRSAWQTDRAIHIETGAVAATTFQPGWQSAMWVLEPVPGTSYYRLRNRWTNQYLHAENGSLQVGPAQPGWWSVMWSMEPVEGSWRIKNRHTGGYLHIEYGSLQMGSIQPGWLSARWSLESAS